MTDVYSKYRKGGDLNNVFDKIKVCKIKKENNLISEDRDIMLAMKQNEHQHNDF